MDFGNRTRVVDAQASGPLAAEVAARSLVHVGDVQLGKRHLLEGERGICRVTFRRPFVVVPAVAAALDGDAGTLQRNVAVAQVLAKQRQELDRDIGLFHERDLRSAVADAHVLQRHVQTGNPADAHSPFDGDLHSHQRGRRRLHARLVGIDIHEDEHGQCRDNQDSCESAHDEEGNL